MDWKVPVPGGYNHHDPDDDDENQEAVPLTPRDEEQQQQQQQVGARRSRSSSTSHTTTSSTSSSNSRPFRNKGYLAFFKSPPLHGSRQVEDDSSSSSLLTNSTTAADVEAAAAMSPLEPLAINNNKKKKTSYYQQQSQSSLSSRTSPSIQVHSSKKKTTARSSSSSSSSSTSRMQRNTSDSNNNNNNNYYYNNSDDDIECVLQTQDNDGNDEYADDDDYDDDEEQGVIQELHSYVPDRYGTPGVHKQKQQQHHHKTTRRTTTTATPTTAAAAAISAYNNRHSALSSLSQCHSDDDEDDDTDRNDDHLSMISSASHLYGEFLVSPSSSAFSNATPTNATQQQYHHHHYHHHRPGLLQTSGSSSSSRITVASYSDQNNAFSNVWNFISDDVRLLGRHVQDLFLSSTTSSILPLRRRLAGQQQQQPSAATAAAALPLSPRSRNLLDLTYLTQQHKLKVQQLSGAADYHKPLAVGTAYDNHFDFCLVLQPQEVYAFWATLLDFRAELLTPEVYQAMEDNWSSLYDAWGGSGSGRNSSIVVMAAASTAAAAAVDEQDTSPSSSSSSTHSPASTKDSDEAMDVLESMSSPGMRRRHHHPTNRPNNNHNNSQLLQQHFTPNRMLPHPSPFGSVRTRLSVFDRAIGGGGGGSNIDNTSSMTTGGSTTHSASALFKNNTNSTPSQQQQQQQQNTAKIAEQATPSAQTLFPIDQQQQQQQRRRWGNFNAANIHTPMAISPPIRSLTRGSSTVRKPVRLVMANNANSKDNSMIQEEKEGEGNDENIEVVVAAATDSDEQPEQQQQQAKQQSNVLRMEDIPHQVIPRGIAARTNGMLSFLSALKRGIVVRCHRPGQEATFCRISSSNGGDTIRYQPVTDYEEAMRALKEQRVRYNTNPSHAATSPQPWSIADYNHHHHHHNMTESAVSHDDDGDDDNNKDKRKSLGGSISEAPTPDPYHFTAVPDYIAAQQYREKMFREHGVLKTLQDWTNQWARSGKIQAGDIVAVHPARNHDPRSAFEYGTATLRQSKSDFALPYSFSVILRTARQRSATLDELEDRWHKGQGSEKQFWTLDFEAATEGEYWLIFRGLLLLHRDAAVGRFAEQRAAGIGSHYRRLEIEQLAAASVGVDHPSSSSGEGGSVDPNQLHPDEFCEPVTVGWLEKLIVKWRELDDMYMVGSHKEGAVPPPSDYFLGFRSPGTAIWSRLRQAGLETQRVYSLDPRRVMIKVRCPSDRLMDVAEVLRLKLKTRDGSFAPFREDMADLYQDLNDSLESSPLTGFQFRSSLRQTIIDFIIGSRIRDSGAELGQTTDLGKMIQGRVPLHMHDKLQAIYDCWFCFWREENWDVCVGRSMTHPMSCRDNYKSKDEESLYSGDDSEDRDRYIPRLWKRFSLGCFHQPLDSIEQYFGEKVAFYFAWLQHTATHLVVLSLAGLVVFVCQLTSGNWDHPLRPYYSVLVMLWTIVVLVNWRKRANFLAYRWGTMDYKERETTRPQFRGDYAQDEITKEWIVTYPKWKRWLKYTISFPLTLLFTGGTLIMILWVHGNRDIQLVNYYNAKGSENFALRFGFDAIGKRGPIVGMEPSAEDLRSPTFWFIMVGLPSMLGLCLPLLNFILMRLSIVLNDFENYRTESEYRSFLIIKVFSFRFVCYFATLYYYSFVSVGDKQAIENGILRVGTGVLVYTTVAQWWQNFVHVCFPMLIRKLRMRHREKRLTEELRSIEIEEEDISRRSMTNNSDALKNRQVQLINKRLLLEQAQDDIWLELMNPQHDSFPEYIQAVVQFTFVSCFSVVLPITPLICLGNYLLSMRLDAYKLCKGRRRPLAEKTGGIGVWEHLLHIVSVISILTNCWLMGFTSSQFTWIGDTAGYIALFSVVVAWEHIMLLIKYIMQSTISPLPKSVRDVVKREQYEIDQQRNAVMMARRLQHQREDEYNAEREKVEKDK